MKAQAKVNHSLFCFVGECISNILYMQYYMQYLLPFYQDKCNSVCICVYLFSAVSVSIIQFIVSFLKQQLIFVCVIMLYIIQHMLFIVAVLLYKVNTSLICFIVDSIATILYIQYYTQIILRFQRDNCTSVDSFSAGFFICHTDIIGISATVSYICLFIYIVHNIA